MKRKRTKALLACLMLATALMVSLESEQVTRASEKSLGGFSKLLANYYESDAKLYDSEELELLSQVMYHENYCNGDYIMLLTGSVVINRVRSSEFPDTIKGVLYQKGQYSTTNLFFTKTIPDSVKDLAKQLLVFGSIAPSNVIYQAMFKQGSKVYYQENGEYFCYE